MEHAVLLLLLLVGNCMSCGEQCTVRGLRDMCCTSRALTYRIKVNKTLCENKGTHIFNDAAQDAEKVLMVIRSMLLHHLHFVDTFLIA
jgi:hypothetical protein